VWKLISHLNIEIQGWKPNKTDCFERDQLELNHAEVFITFSSFLVICYHLCEKKFQPNPVHRAATKLQVHYRCASRHCLTGGQGLVGLTKFTKVVEGE
jgi:hypothetical protein